MAGHIGFELRCAERIFISLNMRQCSDFPELTQTVLSSRENNFLCEAGLLVAGPHPREAGRPVFQVHHIGVRMGLEPLRASAFLGIGIQYRRRASYDPGIIGRRQNEQEDCSLSARQCRQTERQWWPMEGRGSVIPDGNSSSSPPPAPVGLRGVAVVRRDGARRPIETDRGGRNKPEKIQVDNAKKGRFT
jgi:hypothetical protein